MDHYIVKVLKTDYVTHNVKRFVVEKPAGYIFTPGQATDVTINKAGLDKELRPFTFTSPVDATYLEFIIKIYKDHNGVTNALADVNVGDELIIHEVFGTIAYNGPGVFIAGGAGITPFIAILRQLRSENKLEGNTLLFANNTEDDIILKEELTALLGENYVNIIKRPTGILPGKIIDRQLLEACISKSAHYYICGPDAFTTVMVENLRSLGATESQIIIEQ